MRSCIVVRTAAALLALAAVTQASQKPSVLVIGGKSWDKSYTPLREALRENGFNTDSPLRWHQVSLERIRQYDVVVLSLLGVVNADTPEPTSVYAPPAYFTGLAETLVNPEEITPEQGYVKEELEREMGEALELLTPRERDIVIRYYGLGREETASLEAIGHDINLSRERVRQIRNQALAKIRQTVNGEKLVDYLQ